MAKRQIDELYRALTVGLHAVQYLAMKIHSSGRAFEVVELGNGETTCTKLAEEHRMILREATKQANALLQLLGEFENEKDGVEQDDEDATAHAFALMRRLKDAERASVR